MDSNVISIDRYEKKRESRRIEQRKKNRRKRMHYLIYIVCIVCVLLVMYVIGQSQCGYYVYKDSKNTEENEGVNYETFADGYIKYSANGIEYMKSFKNSKSIWNVGLSYSRPFVVKSDKYVLIGDRGGNQAALFDTDGQVQSYTLTSPIIHLDVADNGYIAAVLQGDGCNYVQVLDPKKAIVAETRASLGETGYPLTLAISPDATHLAVSFYTVSDLTGKAAIGIYDLSKQIQSEDVNVSFEYYEGTLFPKMHFYSDSRLVAFGNESTYIFDVSDGIKQTKKITFNGQIESVFSNEKYFGYVCESNDPNQTGYRFLLYNKKGRKIADKQIDMSYDDIYMSGNDIIASMSNECTIINKHGNILFQGELEGGRIENVLPCSGWRTYQIIFNNKIVKAQFTFLGSNN